MPVMAKFFTPEVSESNQSDELIDGWGRFGNACPSVAHLDRQSIAKYITDSLVSYW
jgi:hypothetical protein